MDKNESSPWFIGAQAENHELFEHLFTEFLHDHMFWRRNFYPDDPPSIPAQATHTPEYADFVARMKDELNVLSASLKASVPSASPRYMGHMISDPLMPGLLAQMLALPYNPDNVSDDATPVTIDLEIKVGLQLARMIGYNDDPDQAPCAFGYLSAGGALSNYHALQVLRSVKYYPLALQTGMRRMRLKPPADSALAFILQSEPGRLSNLSMAECIEAREAWLRFLNHDAAPGKRTALEQAVNGSRIETLGTHAFFSLHRKHCSAPVVLVPETAHHSWVKAVRLLGIGETGLVRIATRGMRLNPEALEHSLAAAKKIGQDILCVVGVLGTSEFGTFDPIDEIIAARDRWYKRGLGFAVHADAAWGGYLAALFRDGEGGTIPREQVAQQFKYFPSRSVYAAFRDLKLADSVTVDPHKLGYLPYGVGGAYVCRDHRCVDFVAIGAPRPDHTGPGQSRENDYFRKFRRLGSYILEGSKTGAAAAAAYVTHRVLPLDTDHFGKLLAHNIRNAEYFYNRIHALRERLVDQVRISVPIKPDSNLVCIAFNPAGNESLAAANTFTENLFSHLRFDRTIPRQTRAFFSSSAILYKHMLSRQDARRIFDELNITAHAFTQHPESPENDANGLLVLRHTLINPWLRDELNGVDYIEKYCGHLERLILQLLTAPIETQERANSVH